MDRNDGVLTAIVCDQYTNDQQHILRAEAYLYSTCLLFSVPCLLLTAFFYLKIDEFRDIHGKSLACHSICLAVAYTFLIVIEIKINVSITLTYIIQYHLLACICWLNALCWDICVKLW